MKGMIFTTDAIFALVIVGAAISIVLYFNYASQSPYTAASNQAQAILGLLSTTRIGNLNSTLSAVAQCSPNYGAFILPAAVQYYLNGTGSCATYLVDAAYPATSNYGVFINKTYAPSLDIASFTGVNSKVNVPVTSTLDPYSQFSVSGWVDAGNTGSNNWAVGIDNSGQTGFVVGISSTGNVFFQVGSGTSFGSAVTASGNVVGSWIHFVATYNGTKALLYVNGAQSGNPITVNTVAWYPSSLGLNIGYVSSGGTPYFNGLESNVQMYNTALSSGQVSSLYQEGVSGAPLGGAGNIGWWLLEGDTHDYSGYNNTGTPTNVIYTNGNYVPTGFKNAYSITRAGTILPFNKFQGLYYYNRTLSNYSNVYTYSGSGLYTVGVYTWR